MRALVVAAWCSGAARALAPFAGPRWFDPAVEFDLEEAVARDPLAPVLLVLPGLDGSGITAMTQFAELAREFQVEAMQVPPEDRSSFESLVEFVDRRVAAIEATTRKVFVLGESMGAGVALRVARNAEARGAPLRGVVVVSPATGWDRSWLGARRKQLVRLPDSLFGLVLALSAYQIFDAGQLRNALERTLTREWPPLLATKARQDFLLRMLADLPRLLSAPPATVRHRLEEWVEATIDERARLGDLAQTPVLVVAGTSDARVPASEEAAFFQRTLGDRCTVVLVEGAGHAGALDERIDLRRVMRDWQAAMQI